MSGSGGGGGGGGGADWRVDKNSASRGVAGGGSSELNSVLEPDDELFCRPNWFSLLLFMSSAFTPPDATSKLFCLEASPVQNDKLS